MIIERTVCDQCKTQVHKDSHHDEIGWIVLESGMGHGVSTFLTAGRKKDGTPKSKFRSADKTLHFCSFLCLRQYIEGGK